MNTILAMVHHKTPFGTCGQCNETQQTSLPQLTHRGGSVQRVYCGVPILTREPQIADLWPYIIMLNIPIHVEEKHAKQPVAILFFFKGSFENPALVKLQPAFS